MRTKNHKTISVKGTGLKIGIAVSRFNQKVTEQLLQSAQNTLTKSKVKDITVIKVAGAMELPFALQTLAKAEKYDCLVALGCIIKGETPHFDYVCKMTQEGALRVSLDNNIPIGFGVLTLNSLDQVKDRIVVGGEATMAALELALLNKGSSQQS